MNGFHSIFEDNLDDYNFGGVIIRAFNPDKEKNMICKKEWQAKIAEKKDWTGKVKIGSMPKVNIDDYEDDGLGCARGVMFALAVELGFAFVIVLAVLVYIILKG